MKKIFTLLMALMALALPSLAQSSDSKPKTPVTLEHHPIVDTPNQPPHRAPIHISIEAWYDADASVITVTHNGESSGEVLLYRDGLLIDSSSEINTTFPVYESGFYTIEINADSWTAIGSIEI